MLAIRSLSVRSRDRVTVHEGGWRAVRVLGRAARTRTFWMLAGGFAICGASTNGLIGTHFVSAAHQVGAALAATGAGAIRDLNGSYDLAFFIAGGLCAAAALISATIARRAFEPTAASPAQPSTVG